MQWPQQLNFYPLRQLTKHDGSCWHPSLHVASTFLVSVTLFTFPGRGTSQSLYSTGLCLHFQLSACPKTAFVLYTSASLLRALPDEVSEARSLILWGHELGEFPCVTQLKAWWPREPLSCAWPVCMWDAVTVSVAGKSGEVHHKLGFGQQHVGEGASNCSPTAQGEQEDNV